MANAHKKNRGLAEWVRRRPLLARRPFLPSWCKPTHYVNPLAPLALLLGPI